VDGDVEALLHAFLLGAFLGPPASLALLDPGLAVVHHDVDPLGPLALAQLRWSRLEVLGALTAGLPKRLGALHLTVDQLLADPHHHPVGQVGAHREAEAALEESAALLEGVQRAEQGELGEDHGGE